MASTNPTLNSMLKALSDPKIDSLDKVITCIEPVSKLDRIKNTGFNSGMRDSIIGKITSFPAPADKDTWVRLAKAMINSNFERSFGDQFEYGLLSVLEVSAKTNQNSWIESAMEHVFHAVFYFQASRGYELIDWAKTNSDNPELMREVSRYAIKSLRYKKLAQNQFQARAILSLLDTLLDIDQDLLDLVQGTDYKNVEGLCRKAGKSDYKILSWAKRAALTRIATNNTQKPKNPKL